MSSEEKTIRQKFQAYHQIREDKNKLKIAYFPFRGKGQLLRLLCQYMGVQYQNFFFTPITWDAYKSSTKNQMPINLPFIKDEDFIISGIFPTCIYIIQKYDHSELLGKSIHERAKIENYILSAQVFANLMLKYLGIGRFYEGQFQSKLKQFYSSHMEKKILDLIEDCNQDADWFMGYLTLIDFHLFILGDFLKLELPDQFQKFQPIKKIHKNFSQLTPIKQYINSSRYIREASPCNFFKQFKIYLQLLKNDRANQN